MAINTGKVVAGGLLAGLVLNVLDVTENMTVFAAENEAMLKRLNLNPAIATDFSYAVPWIVVDFVMGLLVVFTYAGLRPRFGPGPKTAVIAGSILWLAVTSVLTGFASMGVFTESMVIKGSLFAIVNVAIGSVVGAWVYTE
jgi:hypothetical protein